MSWAGDGLTQVIITCEYAENACAISLKAEHNSSALASAFP